ncbi:MULTISPECIES: exodeoxyribonuclease V subunit beta [Comamonas]|uniref:exodeoxyribonuclease V subunit beta n=1 Tax=Comamonas TaxID=283 RepID=UPI0001DA64D3|nr:MULTISPECIES: exodeoxyribonuclease V subunit beta [Comamonas]EFI61706.1 exodeoxyribonuclease V, beta subunit [Comamonas thiooxydans]TFF57571.1 exodeoxyribonuclease V subunit beta [Comamonas sp. A23]
MSTPANPMKPGSQALQPLHFPLWGSRLIEASAGTGKTWTIAALYLRLVLGHGAENGFARALMPPDILVMTFTRAATRELSDRIRARLIEAVQCFRGEAEPAAHDSFLRDLRDAYAEGELRDTAAWRLDMAAQCMDDAAIHTIDAWCQRMLREHAFDSGNLFDETLEADESQRQTEAAQDYWRQQCYPLSGEVLEAALQVWPDVQALVKDMQSLLRENIAATAGAGTLGECITQTNAERAQRLQALADGWEAKAERMLRWIEGELDGRAALWDKRKLQARYYTGWFTALTVWAQDPLNRSLELSDSARKRLSPEGMAEAFKGSTMDLLLPTEFSELEQLLKALTELPSIKVALRLHAAVHVQQRLLWLKRQAGTFGFADMQQRLDAALAGDNGPALQAGILAQYPVALIDEFQDTSPLQYRLFDQIYRTADNSAGSALLLIGDPKQSIYGFRGADIYSYLQARQATEGRHYVLDTNFRSTEALVDAVNQWFVQAEVREGEGAFMFRAGQSNPLPFESVKANGRKELLMQGSQRMAALTIAWDGSSDEPLSNDDIRRRGAEFCASQIVQWLMDGATGFAEAGQPLQRLRPADIAVLVRTGKEAAAVRRALARRNVASVYLSDQDSVFASGEAQDLLLWLRAVAAPLDGLAVRAGLATPMMGLSFDELAWLASDDEAFDARSELLKELHSLWQRLGVLAMLRQTLYRFELPARWLKDMGGERRLTNYLHLAELLQGASAQLEGEQALIRWLATQIESPGAAGDAQIVRLESDADLVKVVTVHKSKGLEYPLVCLPFGGSFRPVDGKAAYLSLPVQIDGAPARELVLDYDDAQLAQADKERLREDLRLLYVALTRPRHALWMGLAPMKRGNSKNCVNEQGAAGYLLAGDVSQAAASWRASIQALSERCTQIAVVDLPAELPVASRYVAAQALPALAAAPVYEAQFDRRWGIGSFSSLTRAMAAPSLPVLPVAAQSPAEDERALQAQEAGEAALDLGVINDVMTALPNLTRFAAGARSDAAVWHRFMRGPVVGNFLHDQLEWLAAEDFALLPEDDPGNSEPLAARLLRRCERAGRKEQAADVLQWLRAVVHQPLAPLGVSLAQLGEGDALLPEMEFWLPARRLSAPGIDALCRRHILAGQPRPVLPERELHGMLMGFADLVFHHGGRYWVLDYKTNHLGQDGAAYAPQALEQAMLEHRYDVQAALYLLALHRLLQSRLGAAYDPREQLGGALYFFLRGLDGEAAGMHVLKPPLALLDGLEALLGDNEKELKEEQP